MCNKTKKNCIFIIILINIFIISFVSASQTYANGYEITDLNSFKNELNRLVSENENLEADDKQIKQLTSITSPQIIEKFLDEKMIAVQKYLENNNSNALKRNQIIDLGDYCTLQVDNSNIELTSTPGAQTIWKDYGARRYTCTFKGEFRVASFSLSLCNHYTLSAKGITPRYWEAWGDGAGFLNVTHGNINKPKQNAKKGETVSSNCIFKVKANIGPATGEQSIRMNNFVKCSDIDTIEKQVKVVESWRGDYL